MADGVKLINAVQDVYLEAKLLSPDVLCTTSTATYDG